MVVMAVVVAVVVALNEVTFRSSATVLEIFGIIDPHQTNERCQAAAMTWKDSQCSTYVLQIAGVHPTHPFVPQCAVC